MISPDIPKDEKERLKAVEAYNLLDTLPESDFDNLTNLISNICEVPISLITLLDSERNYLKSHHGISLQSAPRNTSFCGHAILEDDEIFIIRDARLDERFCDNPVIKEFKTVFYAGVPLVNPEGFKLGTLCVYDIIPRDLTLMQRNTLIAIAKQVVNLFELRKRNSQLTHVKFELQQRNERLNQFAQVISHDLTSPLANITSLTRLLREENVNRLSSNSLQYLEYLEESSKTLKEYISGILKFYKSEALVSLNKEDIYLNELLDSIEEMLAFKDAKISYSFNQPKININKSALTQILLNLIDNGIKYNPNKMSNVKIDFEEDDLYYRFTVQDDGRGIEPEKQDEIFDLFQTAGVKDKDGKEGTGVGLATVKSLVNKLGGAIQVFSEIGKGSTFTFSIRK
ncbi:sensor histidine kinase [Ulvibacter antarcticus]|uniref:histidine kinase n=1 Tax=Ulvibacter antarcticus TaxID=442714 RepID=A0A3L9YZH8_9FLAO|nr:GAF domain-containing sensor histidine kinase [Ulvibacter antarcticus]RMA64509.1 GAF sensor signal transduction histidine kinase [Ulvibacter antarcticus]